MLYYLLYEKLFRYATPFRVFRYTTFRTAFASLTALFLCIALGPWLIRKLREFQIGQHIREDGPKSHHKKAGTPTMGGILIIISIVLPVLLWADLRDPYVWLALFALVAFGVIGFIDDYAKVMNKRNLGLTARRKFGLQMAIAKRPKALPQPGSRVIHSRRGSALASIAALRAADDDEAADALQAEVDNGGFDD